MSDDSIFLAQFEAGDFPPEQFDHRHHLWLAWAFLKRVPVDEAVNSTCHGLKSFAEGLGVYDKFNWTVTEALVRLMAARMQRGQSFDAFLAANADLVQDAEGVLLRYYSRERLAADAARTDYLLPDKRALDHG